MLSPSKNMIENKSSYDDEVFSRMNRNYEPCASTVAEQTAWGSLPVQILSAITNKIQICS